MKLKEYIRLLEELPQDLEVMRYDDGMGVYFLAGEPTVGRIFLEYNEFLERKQWIAEFDVFDDSDLRDIKTVVRV